MTRLRSMRARATTLHLALALLLVPGLSAASWASPASSLPTTAAGPHRPGTSVAPPTLIANAEWTERSIKLPGVGTGTAYVPVKPTNRVAIFISGDGGWNLGVVDMARRFAPQAVVIGVSYPALRHTMGAGAAEGKCWYPAGDLETLSHAAQKELGLPQYVPPLLIGYSSGATLVYAALAAAPPGTFAGAISLGFCPDLPSDRAVCSAGTWHPTYDLKQHAAWLPATQVPRAWYVLHGIQDQVCALDETKRFLASIPRAQLTVIDGTGHGFSRTNRWGGAFDRAFDEIWRQADLANTAGASHAGDSANHARASSSSSPPSSPATVPQIASDLDRLQLSLQYRWAEHPRAAMLFVSGDGGWASLDDGVATVLQQHDISVVGISALRYFWQPRTPERVAQDFHAIVAALGRLDVPVFIGGYSFGAAVVPIALTHWPDADRQSIAGLVLLTPGPSASFEIDPLDWLRTPKVNPATRIAPALRAMALPTLCVLGTTEDADECPSEHEVNVGWGAAHGAPGAVDVAARGVTGVSRGQLAGLRIVRLPGSHHFHGDYAAVGRAIADFVSDRAAATAVPTRAAQAVRRSTPDGRKGPIS